MKPGRELDALIAEKVMGWPTFAPQALGLLNNHLLFGQTKGEQCLICARNDDTKECLPHFSTNIAAAWTVVEKLYMLVWREDLDGTWGARSLKYMIEKTGISRSDSAPHAICLAALKVFDVNG